LVPILGDESVFQTSVQKGRRVVIPRPICDALKIEKGDKVRIVVEKVKEENRKCTKTKP
jgi:bifunctional DNA-binding transcriptional regulator/antitoxin component of YhaV-PrlF toxin-antitoxin module